MLRRALAPAVLAACLLAPPPAAAQSPNAAVRLLEPVGTPALKVSTDELRFRWKVEMTVAKIRYPGRKFRASTLLHFEGQLVEAQDKDGGRPTEDGLVESVAPYRAFLAAAKKAGFSLDKPGNVTWSLNLVVAEGPLEGTSVFKGEGHLVADVRARSGLSVSVVPSDFPNESPWPSEFLVKNFGQRRSNPTTLRVKVQRLDEEQDVVRRSCPVLMPDANYQVLSILGDKPFRIKADRPRVEPPKAIVGSAIQGTSLAKAGAGAAPFGTTPTPPTVQQVVNCRFVVRYSVPLADNPDDEWLQKSGGQWEYPFTIQAPLR